MSEDYDLLPQAIPSYFDLQEAVAKRIAAEYSDFNALEVGFGTGLTTKAVVDNDPFSAVTAFDNEPSMLEQATERLSNEVKSGRVKLCAGDALEGLQELRSASFEVVFSSFTIHNCDAVYRDQLFSEIARILRPGGMFINNDKYASDDREEYVRELSAQLIRFDILATVGRSDLRKLWIEHEIEDQVPERIMWTRSSLLQLEGIGLSNVSLWKRVGQYAIVTAHKPAEI
jgi:ubiquinone/menaquinone biosynthesis C-methylase UbiE